MILLRFGQVLYSYCVQQKKLAKISKTVQFISILFFAFVCVMSATISTSAATFTVTKTADTTDGACDTDCSLREAIVAANAVVTDDIVEFDETAFSTNQTILLKIGQLSVINNGSLIINGSTTSDILISGNNSSRVFFIDRLAIVTLNNLSVISGNGFGEPQTFSGSGAGILNLDGVLTINNSTISNNSALSFQDGGGICNAGGSLTVVNTTIKNNSAIAGTGGGIYNFTPTGIINLINSTISNNSAISGSGISSIFGTVNLTNSTIAFNTATGTTGGGIINDSGTINARNTIIANNTSGTRGADFFGTLTSQGYNLIKDTNSTTITGTTTGNITRVDPRLLPLRNYGGATETHALRAVSPAVDKGNNFGIMTDQRGLSRPFDHPSVPNTADGSDIGAFERQINDPAEIAAFDFDGDFKTDISIFRPAAGEWWYLRSSDGSNRAFQFGASTDRIVPADYTGDGKTDIAFWRESTGEWFVIRSEDNSFYSFPFGASGDIPAPADFDGDGTADVAIFRPTNATWFIIRSRDSGTTITTFGANGDQPVAADYDGDGKADVAIYRPSTGAWWLGRSSAGVFVTNFGTSTDRTVPADYTGDGKTDVAFFRPATGEWFILRSEDSSFYSMPFGASGDIAAPGDYDGDGAADYAVFRPSNATWYVQQSTSGFAAVGFGAAGDTPVPNAFVR